MLARCVRAGTAAAVPVLAALCAWACGAGDARSRGPRLVVLYAPCTVNADKLAPYHASVATTPHLEAFQSQAVVFERHQTEAGQSGIAYASLFSGVQADRHGVYRHPVRLSEELVLIGESFRDAGYETFFWNDHRAASAALRYGQGVDAEHSFARPLRADDPSFLEILERLRSDPDYRAFAMTNFTVTHAPYDLAALGAFGRRYPGEVAGLDAPEALRFARLYRAHSHELALNLPRALERLALSPEQLATLLRVIELLYASNVSRLDALFGAVVDAIDARGLRDHSLVAFTADHGEVLYRESALFQWSHAMQLAAEVLRVPLLIRAPGLEGGRRYAGVTRSIDVFPTLAGLAGVEVPASVEGVDLAGALRGRAPAPELSALSHTTVVLRSVFQRMYAPQTREVWERARALFPEPDVELVWVALREGDALVRHTRRDGRWRVETFDLARDPEQRRDVFDAADPAHREWAAALAEYKARLVAGYGRAAERERDALLPEEEEVHILRELGYIQ